MTSEAYQQLDVIAVGAHPDDIEIACGGTLASLVDAGYKVGIIVLVRAKVRDANRDVHQATWAYCGERYHFVQMAANNGAALRAQIDQAAAVLAEAIPYDLYVSKQPRHLLMNSTCMDFRDLPSGRGTAAPR